MNPPGKKIDFAVGGQAIMEGVMMRSPHYYVMAVRHPAGHIVVEPRRFVSWTRRHFFWKLPLVRGVVTLAESLFLGVKALMFSNDVAFSEAEPKAVTKKKTAVGAVGAAVGMGLYFLFVFGVAIFLFKFLPLLVAQYTESLSPLVRDHYWIFNVVDGFTKIFIFVLYIFLISFIPDIRRVFGYHGAEHQAIWAYEKGHELTIREAQKEHPEHPRCGTSFIILVLLLSIAVYTALPSDVSFGMKLLQRVAVLPLLAGLSYEVLKVSAKYEERWWMRWVTLPGLWLQKITTRKPTDDMEEVAIAALKGALESEAKERAA